MYSSFRKGLTVFSMMVGFLGVGLFTSIPLVSADSGTGTGPTNLISPATLPATYIGTYTEWSMTLSPTAESVVTPIVWMITSGSLPNGMTLQQPPSGSRTAKIVGTPILHGSNTITISAVTHMNTAYDPQKTYTLVVRPMEVSALTVQEARAGVPYAQTLLVAGGTAPYTWTVSEGSLPQGLILSPAGVITGTPSYALGTTFTARVNDSTGQIAYRQFFLDVRPDQDLAISTTSVPTGSVGQGYSTNFAAVGGTATYRWSLDSGTLPTGLTFSEAGRLSGTFGVAGTYTFSVKVTDAANRTSTRSYTMVVSGTGTVGSSLAIGTSTLPAGAVGIWYGFNLGASGGNSPYTWSRVDGSLPAGLAFDPAGAIYGTPTTAGTSSFTISVRDASGASVSRTYSITITGTTTETGTTPGTGTTTGTGTATGSGTVSADLAARLRNLDAIGATVHQLIKLPDDGNRLTQEDSAVYYVGTDGRRHAFPNERVFFTWYTGFDNVRVLTSAQMASIPLGANATYHPGTRMVKFTTDPKVYAVDANRTLRWVGTEDVAKALYGEKWSIYVDDIADTFYLDYSFGTDVRSSSDFSTNAVRGAVSYVSDTLPVR